MKFLKKTAVALIVLVLLGGLVFVALGLILPDQVSVNNEIEINASPEEVWQVMDEKEKYAEWVPNLEKVEVITEQKWKEFPKGTEEAIIFETVNIQKPARYEVKYQMQDVMAGEWRAELEEAEKGTLVKTEDKLIHRSWFGKIMMPLFFDLDAFAKDFNQKLKNRVESLKSQ